MRQVAVEPRGACPIDTPSADGCQVLLRLGVGLVRSRRGPLSESAPRFAQSVALAVGFQDVDAVGEAVEQGSREPLGAQDLGPALEGQVGGDEQARALVGPADDLEEEFGSRLGAGEVDDTRTTDPCE